MSERVLWEGDQYRAVVVYVKPDKVVFRPQQKKDDNGRWGNIIYVADMYHETKSFVGFREPEIRWYHKLVGTPNSIAEAAQACVQWAMERERQYHESQRQVEHTRRRLDAVIEIEKIAANL